jgi:hypothetical protein
MLQLLIFVYLDTNDKLQNKRNVASIFIQLTE